jgi:repressor LexA
MSETAARSIRLKVQKLVEIESALKKGERREITCLTSIKSLCKEPDLAHRFASYLAQRALERDRKKRPAAREQLVERVLTLLDQWPEQPGAQDSRRASECLAALRSTQSKTRRIPWGHVRVIHDNNLLLLEIAVESVIYPEQAGYFAYQAARHYAERYDSRYGTGLIPASAPFVRDIADFFLHAYPLPSIDRPRRGTPRRPVSSKPKFTRRQGEYLAYIHLYRKLHRQAPSEADLVSYFGVTPPTAHSMVVRLEENGLITREPGVPRSMRVAIPEDEIPALN